MSILFSLIAYAAILVFVVGFALRIKLYMQTPAPLKIPVTPAPVTRSGVWFRMFTEVALFNSLFKSNKWTWLFGYAFHAALLVVLVRHLRYFVNPLPHVFALVNIAGIIAGLVMVGALGMLLVRRYWVPRVRHISSVADYFALVLLILIGVSGLAMDFVTRPDIVTVKAAMTGLFTFSFATMPSDGMFLLHFLLVVVLLVYFPFSKLMHLGGIFFAPTRYQVDNPREEKHVNPWAKEL